VLYLSVYRRELDYQFIVYHFIVFALEAFSNNCSHVAFQANCGDFESRLNAECDAVVSAVRRRQQQLIANARREKALKQQAYRDQVAQCTSKVHRTTGLLQYTVEVMKEADQTAFLQVRSPPPPPPVSVHIPYGHFPFEHSA